jgi:hypothetical protein
MGRTNRLLFLISQGPYRKRRVQNSSTVTCVFVAAVTFLRSRCLANSRLIFTEPLPTNDRRIHTKTHALMVGISEVRRSDGLRCHYIYIYIYIYTASFRKFGSATRKLIRGTHRLHGDRISLLSFFKIRKAG